MTFTEALTRIREFWVDGDFPFRGSAGESRVSDLEREFGRRFREVVREYISSVIGPRTAVLEKVGNPIELYAPQDLSQKVPGYNFNPVTNETIHGWSDDWLLIGHEGADPIIVQLNQCREVPVLQAMHGAGEWEFSPVADSLPQFLLLAAALHHAMFLGPSAPDERVSDDEAGFNLNSTAAEWLFPRVRMWAPNYYKDWVGVFDNSCLDP